MPDSTSDEAYESSPGHDRAGEFTPAQLFEPLECRAVLPVGRIRQRSVFWRTTALDVEIDTAELVNETKPVSKQIRAGVGRFRLGLPIGLVAPEWARRIPTRSVALGNGDRVSVSGDGLFLPSEEIAGAVGRGVASVPVDDLNKLEAGTFPYAEGAPPSQSESGDSPPTLQLAPESIDILLQDGVAYARMIHADGRRGGLVLVSLLVSTVPVAASAIDDVQVAVTLGGKAELVGVTRAQQRLLRAGTPVAVRHQADALLLVPPTDGRVGPLMRGESNDLDGGYEVSHDFDDDSDGGMVTALANPSKKKLKLKKAKQAAREAAIEAAKERSRELQLRAKGWGSPLKELPRYEIGLAVAIAQTWRLVGYERGALVGSISLEPGAEATLEVFTSERQRIERDEQTGTTFERSSEVSGLGRTTSRVAVDAATELGTTMNFGGSATIPVEGASLGAQVSGSADTAIKTSVQSGLERVVEAMSKSTTRFQMTHQVKVVHTTERGSESRATRKLTNPNPGRILEFLHFEICERHCVTTRVEGPARLVVFVENPTLGAFDIPFIFAHEHVLKSALLSGDYQSGFSAARTLYAQSWFEDSLRKREQEVAASTAGSPSPTPPAAETAADGVPTTGIYQTARQLKNILKEFIDIDLAREADILIQNLDPIKPAEEKPSKADVKKAEARFSRWGFWARFSAAYPGIEDKAATFVQLKFDGPGHATEEEVVAALQQFTDGLDDDWLTAIKMVVVATVVGVALSLLTGPAAGILQPFLIGLLLLSDDMGLPAAITRARRELPGERALQQGETLVAAGDAAGAGAPLPAAPAAPPQIVPDVELAMANADYEKLRRHLEAHRTYYENAIWAAEDPNDRFARLDVTGVARFVDNVLLGFVGTRAMYPLRLTALPDKTQEKIEAVCGSALSDEKYAENFSIDEVEVSLPTPAIHTQAYLGDCDLLEPYMRARRDIDLRTRTAAAFRDEAYARQQEVEVERLQFRLEQTPPLLDSPWATQSHMSSEVPNPLEPATGEEAAEPANG
jgi:hypothetical protein